MPVFEYRPRTQRGSRNRETIVADTPRHARDLLRAQGIEVDYLAKVSTSRRSIETAKNSISSQPSKRKGFRLTEYFERRYATQVSWFVREMATLLRVGTPVVESLQLSIQQSNGYFRSILQDIQEQVTSGVSLGQALRSHPRQFDVVLCELVVVGEQSGALQQVLFQAAQFRERKDKLKDRVFSALLYPSLVLCLSVVVSVFLMTVVTPSLIASLEDLGHPLPWPTQVLKMFSDFLLNWGWQAGVVLLVAVVVVSTILRKESAQRSVGRGLLQIPLFGPLILKQNCSRFCMVTSTLLKSGVELVRSLEIAQESVTNLAISDVLREARGRIAAGSDLATALQSKQVLPAALIQIFSLGQNTGELDELLLQVAQDYDHQVNIQSDRITTVLEPILIIGLSAIVGFILFATLLPILETGNALSNS